MRSVRGLRTTLRSSLWDMTPRDHRQTDREFRRRQVVSVVVVLVGAVALAVTNRPHSSLARRSDAVLETGAGPEIGVAATKTFTTQVVAGAALAIAHAAATGALAARRWLAVPPSIDI